MPNTIKYLLKKTIKIDNLHCKVIFVVTDEVVDLVNQIIKNKKYTTVFEGPVEGVMVSGDISEYYIIIDSKYLSHNTIAHEVFHAVLKINNDRGITDEEAGAWLLGYITEHIYKSLSKKKLTVKNG